MQVLLVFYSADIGHTHLVVDASPVLVAGADSADMESAINWAYEKYGNGRECISSDIGTSNEIRARVQSVFSHSLEVKE
jgi:hypothetical protein